MARGDRLLAVAGELRPVARHRRIDVERAAVDEHVGAQRRHRLRRREDVDDGVALPRARARRVGMTAPQIDDRRAVARRRKRGADLTPGREVRCKRLAHRFEPRRAVAVNCARRTCPTSRRSPPCGATFLDRWRRAGQNRPMSALDAVEWEACMLEPVHNPEAKRFLRKKLGLVPPGTRFLPHLLVADARVRRARCRDRAAALRVRRHLPNGHARRQPGQLLPLLLRRYAQRHAHSRISRRADPAPGGAQLQRRSQPERRRRVAVRALRIARYTTSLPRRLAAPPGRRRADGRDPGDRVHRRQQHLLQSHVDAAGPASRGDGVRSALVRAAAAAAAGIPPRPAPHDRGYHAHGGASARVRSPPPSTRSTDCRAHRACAPSSTTRGSRPCSSGAPRPSSSPSSRAGSAVRISETEARRLLVEEGQTPEAIDQTLAHLSGAGVSALDAAAATLARESIWVRPAQIQRYARSIRSLFTPEQFIELLGIAALANTVCRLGVAVDIAQPRR